MSPVTGKKIGLAAKPSDPAIATFVANGGSFEGKPPSGPGKLTIVGTGQIFFGDNVTLPRAFTIKFYRGGTLRVGNAVTMQGRITIGGGSVVAIGSNTHINRPCVMVAAEGANIAIGADCLLSDATLRTCDMHSVIDASGARVNPSGSIVLEDRVWLGEHSYVGKGIVIGHDSVVGANAVVVKSVRPHTVVAGNPAKEIRSGITWSRRLHPLPPRPPRPY